jgi:hypothetical protein
MKGSEELNQSIAAASNVSLNQELDDHVSSEDEGPTRMEKAVQRFGFKFRKEMLLYNRVVIPTIIFEATYVLLVMIYFFFADHT